MYIHCTRGNGVDPLHIADTAGAPSIIAAPYWKLLLGLRSHSPPLQVLPEYIPALYQRFHAKKWEKFNSEKVCNISYARIQGKSSLIHHFSNSSLLHEDKRCRPIIFRSDGRLAGEQEPFPVASHVSRPSNPPPQQHAACDAAPVRGPLQHNLAQ